MSNNLILVMRDSSVSSWSSPRARFAATIWRLHGPASAPPAVCRVSWRSLSPSGPWRTCVRVTTSSPYENCRTNELNTSSERGHGTSTDDSGYNPGPVRARGSLRPSGGSAMLDVVGDGSCCICLDSLEESGLGRHALPCGHVQHEPTHLPKPGH